MPGVLSPSRCGDQSHRQFLRHLHEEWAEEPGHRRQLPAAAARYELPAAAPRYELPAAAARYEHLAGKLRPKTLASGCAQGARTRSCRVLSPSLDLYGQVQQQLLQMQIQLQQQQYQLELLQRQMYAPRVPAWSPWPRHVLVAFSSALGAEDTAGDG